MKFSPFKYNKVGNIGKHSGKEKYTFQGMPHASYQEEKNNQETSSRPLGVAGTQGHWNPRLLTFTSCGKKVVNKVEAKSL